MAIVCIGLDWYTSPLWGIAPVRAKRYVCSSAMLNIYELSLGTNNKTLTYDGFLFVEYHCLPGDKLLHVWSEHNHMAYIVSGRKTFITPERTFTVHAGDAVFFKKGAYCVENHFEEHFCCFLFFMPDNFIQEVVRELQPVIALSPATCAAVIQLEVDTMMQAFFHSMIVYFQHTNIAAPLLKLKFRELILQILLSNNNIELAACFLQVTNHREAELHRIMQDNFLYNLSLQELARIANKSLSSFKRDAEKLLGMPPKKWIRQQRLKYARVQLLSTDLPVTDIAFHAGFETTSHFIHSFRQQYQLSPNAFRQQHKKVPALQMA